MDSNNINLNRIAEALLFDYSSIYYVNAVTNEYEWYSFNPEFRSLKVESGGKNFFEDLVRDADQVIHEEDKHIFMEDMKKENLVGNMKKGTMQSMVYRLMIDGKPVWHTVRLIRGFSENDDYFILGVLNIDDEVKKQRQQEKLEKENNAFDQIASQLAGRYDTIFYVDLDTDYYVELSAVDIYRAADVPEEGNDFFEESRANAKRLVNRADLPKILEVFTKDKILKMLQKDSTVQVDYSLFIEEKLLYLRMSIMLTKDKKHLMYCVENRQSDMATEEALREIERKSKTYNQIATSLANRYDSIYYVDVETDKYEEYSASPEYKQLKLQTSGNNFFDESMLNIPKVIYEDDKEAVLDAIRKENILSQLNEIGTYSLTYRLMMEGKPCYMNLRVVWAEDHRHVIIGLQNVDAQIRKENDQKRALRSAREKALRDELTGVKNKNAYQEYENEIQKKIEDGSSEPFAMVVCDLNNLKIINDTYGHKAGDKYIREACKMICHTFTHSPVFRIGGDEFVAILTESDFDNREELMEHLQDAVMQNLHTATSAVLACGISDFDVTKDTKVSDIFDRADELMYENKRMLKAMAS